jgi:hypothetical protein
LVVKVKAAGSKSFTYRITSHETIGIVNHAGRQILRNSRAGSKYLKKWEVSSGSA